MQTIDITVNGRRRKVPAATSLAMLLDQLDVARASVAVEVNRELVPREDHDQHHLQPGDTVEIVTLVGGG
jgi:thiamine biosynthesis protein ThiS